MHELSIAHAVVGTVADALPGRRVLRVQLRAGVLSGVVPEALAFAWDVATAGTSLAGSVLDVRRVALEGVCADCGATSSHAAPPPLRCPGCGGRVLPSDSAQARLLEVGEVEIDDEPDGTRAGGHGVSSAKGVGR